MSIVNFARTGQRSAGDGLAAFFDVCARLVDDANDGLTYDDEAARRAWRFSFAPGAKYFAGEILVGDEAVFDRGKEVRVASERGLAEIEFDGEAGGKPVVSSFQAVGKDFVPPTRALAPWRSVAIRRLQPMFDLLSGAA